MPVPLQDIYVQVIGLIELYAYDEDRELYYRKSKCIIVLMR